jgi:hypothetical protein
MTEPSFRPEQTFFEDPSIDRLMGWVFALSAEVYVLRDRLRRFEQAMEAQGTLKPGAVEAFQRTPEQEAEALRDRDAFTAALMENLLGRQKSKGVP